MGRRMSTPVTALTTGPDGFVEDLARRRDERLNALVRLYPRSQPIASDIDPGSCMRRQVLEIVRWEDKAPIPADRQGRLQAGDDAETRGMKELREMGYRVIKEQVTVDLRHRRTKATVLRGRLDGFIRVERDEVQVEVKSMNPWVFDAINRVEDLDRFWWTKKYYFQLQAYMIADNKPWSLLWLTNLAGEWKAIPVRLDYDAAERVWSFAEAIADAVDVYRQASDLPPFTTDPLQCTRCPFFGRSCNPPIEEQGASVLDDPDFELQLIRRAELEPARTEYERLDKRAKDRLRLGPALQVCGEFVIEVTEQKRHESAREARDTVAKIVKIERSGQAPQEGT